MVARETLRIGVLGIFNSEPRAVRQQDVAQLGRALRAVDGTPKAIADQQRQVAAVIDVGMRENDGINVVRVDGQRVPVAQSQ